jgi:hypothetical protein
MIAPVQNKPIKAMFFWSARYRTPNNPTTTLTAIVLFLESKAPEREPEGCLIK